MQLFAHYTHIHGYFALQHGVKSSWFHRGNFNTMTISKLPMCLRVVAPCCSQEIQAAALGGPVAQRGDVMPLNPHHTPLATPAPTDHCKQINQPGLASAGSVPAK